MIQGQSICVVVPAHQEEKLIGTTLESIPSFVDRIIVVDDASRDETLRRVRDHAQGDARIEIHAHSENKGVGGAIKSGYSQFLAGKGDVVCVMAGDAQMDPADLENLLAPVLCDQSDYAKGNRFADPEVRRVMPKGRFFANRVLTKLTQYAAGLSTLSDAQCGYTALRRTALQKIDLDDVYDRYGVPNDLLLRLSASGARITDVPVRAVYGEERSEIKPLIVVPRIVWLILRGHFRRCLSTSAKRSE